MWPCGGELAWHAQGLGLYPQDDGHKQMHQAGHNALQELFQSCWLGRAAGQFAHALRVLSKVRTPLSCLSRRVSLLQGLCCHGRRWLRTSGFSCCLHSCGSHLFSGCDGDLNEHMGLRAGAFPCRAGPPTFPKARGDPEVSGTKDRAITGQENTAHGPCRPCPGPYTPDSV